MVRPASLAVGQSVSAARAAATASEDTDRGTSVADFSTMLERSGLPWAGLIARSRDLDLAAFGDLLGYLQIAVLEGSDTPAALAFHLDFARGIPPADIPNWEAAFRKILGDQTLDAADQAFLESKSIPLLRRKLLIAVRQREVAEPERRDDPRYFVQALIMFLEQAGTLVADDPGVAVVIDAANRFGGIQNYYRKQDLPHATVRQLLAAGYDADYLVFSRQEIASRRRTVGAAAIDAQDPLLEFDQLITRIVGTEEVPPEIELGVDRFKFLNEIHEDRDLMRTEKSRPAANRIARRVDAILKVAKTILHRRGLLVPAARLDEYEHAVERFMYPAAEQDGPKNDRLTRIVARRSAKYVPELFFDDTRLGSWLFKPDGIVHGEICRILLDPAVPLLEVIIEPLTEPMAVVPLYPGFNADRQLTILVETYHYDLRISDLLGPEKTLEFLVEALVIDASLAHAEKLAVFAAPWGRSAEVANYIASLAKRGEPIRYFESYRFELVDPTNAALANSPTGQFHYTESLGYGRPSSGTIDFGYNLVGLGTIDKLTTGGRGIFEIDVRDWLQRDGRQGRVPAKQEGVAQAPDPPLHGNPSERREEIERREQDRLVHARDDIGKRIPGALVEVVGPGDLALRDSVAALHRETASACQEGFVSRLCKQGAELLAVHAGRTVLGAVLAAQLDTLQADAVHLDFVLPVDGCDATVARRLLSLAVELATVRGCRHLFLRPASDAAATIASAEHFVPATGVPSLGPQLYRKLWLFGPENRPAIDAAIEAARRRLAPCIPALSIDLCDPADPGLVDLMLELEKIFPDEMRASREQFAQRLGRNDVCLMLARDDRETIAFVLCYQDPILPAHIYFGDTVGVKHGWQQKGVGSAIIQLVMTMPARSHYTDFLLYCRERSAEGVDLPAYYHRTFGARLLDIDAERVRMLVPIRMHAQPRSFRSEHLADSTILLVAGVSDDRQTYGL